MLEYQTEQGARPRSFDDSAHTALRETLLLERGSAAAWWPAHCRGPLPLVKPSDSRATQLLADCERGSGRGTGSHTMGVLQSTVLSMRRLCPRLPSASPHLPAAHLLYTSAPPGPAQPAGRSSRTTLLCGSGDRAGHMRLHGVECCLLLRVRGKQHQAQDPATQTPRHQLSLHACV